MAEGPAADGHDMECENTQQDTIQAERQAAGSAANRRSAVQRGNYAEVIRRALVFRNEAIQAELDALSAGQVRWLKRRSCEGVESWEERLQAAAASGDWLNTAIAASLRAFGEHMDARITTIAEQGDITAGRLEDHIDRVEMMDRADATNRRLGRHEDAMQKVANTTTDMRSELEATNKRLAEFEERLRAKGHEEAARPRKTEATSAQAPCSHMHDNNIETMRRERRSQPGSPRQAPGLACGRAWGT